MPDLRPLLDKFESLIKSASVTQRAQMLAIHVLYNRMVASENQSPNHDAVHKANERLFDECRIESLVLKMVTSPEWPWAAEDCAQAYDDYAATKFHKGRLSLPWALEVAVIACIADKYRDAGREDELARWAHRALLESAGQSDWQNHIRAIQAEGRDVNLDVFFGLGEDAAPDRDS